MKIGTFSVVFGTQACQASSGWGPKGGIINVKKWRCSRKGIHLYEKSDPYFKGKPCYLCTQHLKIAQGK